MRSFLRSLTAAVLLGGAGSAAAQPPSAGDCTAETHARLLQPVQDQPAAARAVWLDARTVRWPQAPLDSGRFVLYASRGASLTVRPGERVAGATDTVPLVGRSAALATPLARATRHVLPGATLSLARGGALPRMLLAGPLVLVREDGEGRVLAATHTQTARALDALYATAAESMTLGAQPVAGQRTRFALWAPTARHVAVCLHQGTEGARTVALQPDTVSGVWAATVPEAPQGTPYRYLVDVHVPGTGIVRNRVTDPWSLALTANSAQSVVVDLADPMLAPPGWNRRRPPALTHAVDQVIYELHVRDFSVQDERVPPAHRGKYLAFTDTASHGMRHLQALARAGVTDVHLLPVFDIATIPEIGCLTPDVRGTPAGEAQQATVMATAGSDCFNWGYDPLHYTVPEGSYATDAGAHQARIREFRQMVMALNAAGLRVGMDVVYNHTSAAGQSPQSVLDRIVPGYFHRLDADGRVETSTCCANTATEHRLMAKLMIESAVAWVRHYGISSFRFDLMGHQPRAAMERLQRAVNAAAGTAVPLIGEGWNFGEVADGRRFVQASQRALGGSGIATFSDRARDAIRGGSALDDGVAQVRHQGWVNGLGYAPNAERQQLDTSAADRDALRQAADLVRLGLAGTLRDYRFVTASGTVQAGAALRYGGQPAGYVHTPAEVVNYVENHDNTTLFDANVLKLPRGTTMDDRARVQLLASSLVLFSQGIAYVHAGQELLRSKSLDRNSFDSGDWFNSYDPTGARHGFGRGLPPRNDNAASWPLQRERLADATLVPSPATVGFTRAAFLDLLRIRASSSLFRLRTAGEVRTRLRFANVGRAQEPTVIAAHLDGRGLTGANFADLLYAVNADTVAHEVTVPWLAGAPLQLHPVLAAPTAADARVRSARWDRARGVLTVPPRTAVVWGRR